MIQLDFFINFISKLSPINYNISFVKEFLAWGIKNQLGFVKKLYILKELFLYFEN